MGREIDRRGAFEELFAAHYWAVRGYVLRRGPTASAEDVIAETFLIAWRRLDSLGEDPLPWLLGVARRVMANQQRAERRRGALAARLQGLFAGETSHWEAPTTMSEELAVAMVRLSAQEREALLLVAWEGLEPARAARAAGCSAGAFRARLHRARRHVAASLTDSSIAPHSSIAGESS
ncbi:MAG TPA: RNA polymerase sigma factor [Solirubrobacteraceae bacterium]|jgi:RNA polymerase sigma-70 factor (ECF subfamily)|nr:RNA polymerase sigma factor [Solirubrobacteraceae bacterium]